jgi:alpha-D-glucose phosphate-specific phosphoglucomutase
MECNLYGRDKNMIKFGTCGWRGIIAKEFTYANVAVVTQAIANVVNEQNRKAVIVIGFDTRFMSEDFAKTAAEILAGNGIKALLCKRNTPTPVISYDIVHSKLAGGINFTASHNSYKYNGLKYFTNCGSPALPETTKKIEEYCSTLLQSKDIKSISFDSAVKNNLIEFHNPKSAYIKSIKKLVNFRVLKKSKMKVAVDILHGTGMGYLDTLLDDANIQNITINKFRDTMFDGGTPDTSEKNLTQLSHIVKKESCKLGLSIDGDADRFGIIDSDGSFITPNQVLVVLLYHLNKTRNWTGIAVRNVMTTHLIDKLAAKINVEVRETPVGFKYIGDIMTNNPNEFIIGGEESGGLSIRGHIPEKDGILACLLMAEVVAMSKKSIKELLKDIKKLTGEVFTSRLNLYLKQEDIDFLKEILKTKTPNSIAGMKIQKNITVDGRKFILDDSNWMGFRLSGTEPVVRIYAESDSQNKLNKLIKAGKSFVYRK